MMMKVDLGTWTKCHKWPDDPTGQIDFLCYTVSSCRNNLGLSKSILQLRRLYHTGDVFCLSLCAMMLELV